LIRCDFRGRERERKRDTALIYIFDPVI